MLLVEVLRRKIERHTIWSNEPAAQESYPEARAEYSKNSLWKRSHRACIYQIKNKRAEDPCQGMQQSCSTEQLANSIMRYMLGQSGLKGWTTDSS